MEMLRELGFCSGVENYSRILDGRHAGEPPDTLLDFFPDDFVCFIDESHNTMGQLRGMYEGDRSRKLALIDAGFRLPSALDNRPLQLPEFLERVNQVDLRLGDPGRVRAALGGPRGRADHPAHRPGRPRGRGAADPPPDRRPHRRDPRPGRARPAGPRHHADQADGRGPDRVPGRGGHPGPLPALRDRHPGAHPRGAVAAARRLRRAGGGQPAPRGARPARGHAGRDPRRRQGGLPPRQHLADPDDRAGGPERRGAGDHVRRHRDRGHALGHRRDQPAPRRSRSPTTRRTASRRSRS